MIYHVRTSFILMYDFCPNELLNLLKLYFINYMEKYKQIKFKLN